MYSTIQLVGFKFSRDSGILSEDQYAMTNFENGSKKWVLTLLNKGLIIDENQLIKEDLGYLHQIILNQF